MGEKIRKITPFVVIIFIVFFAVGYYIHTNRISKLEIKSCEISHSQNQYGATVATVKAEIYNPLEITLGGFYLEVQTFYPDNPEKRIEKAGYSFKYDILAKSSNVFTFTFGPKEKEYTHKCRIKPF